MMQGRNGSRHRRAVVLVGILLIFLARESGARDLDDVEQPVELSGDHGHLPLPLLDAVNLDLRDCDRTLISQLKAANRVASVEQERNAACERREAAMLKGHGTRERSLNVSIAVLEHKLADIPSLEKERAEALLELKRLRPRLAELEREKGELVAEVNHLKRMQTRIKVQYQEKLNSNKQQRNVLACVLGSAPTRGQQLGLGLGLGGLVAALLLLVFTALGLGEGKPLKLEPKMMLMNKKKKKAIGRASSSGAAVVEETHVGTTTRSEPSGTTAILGSSLPASSSKITSCLHLGRMGTEEEEEEEVTSPTEQHNTTQQDVRKRPNKKKKKKGKGKHHKKKH